jgi:S-DNA-T family DNA segregation ATPase FtsK/SpoIIIE
MTTIENRPEVSYPPDAPGYAVCNCPTLCCSPDRIADVCPTATWRQTTPVAPVVPTAEALRTADRPTLTPTPLHVIRNGHTPTPAPLDLDAPILPLWMTDAATRSAAIRNVWRRTRYRVALFLTQLPLLLWLLLVWYPWFGLGRAVKALGKWIHDRDSAGLRSRFAENGEGGDYDKVSKRRAANLHARWLVALGLVAFLAVPALAYTFPRVLSGLVAVLVWVLVVKLISKRSIQEIAIATVVSVATYLLLPLALEKLPPLPLWPFVTAVAVGWAILGWHGRPRGRKLLKDTNPGGHRRLDAPMVRSAVCSLGVTGLKDPDVDVRLLNDIHRDGPGVSVDVELEGGTAAEVVKRREKLAAQLKRELGCVWPSVGRKHAAHLVLYVADQAMVETPQKRWPLIDGGPVDIFKPQPQATDKRGEWTNLTLAYAAAVIGAQPRMGKTFLLRQWLLTAALDVRPRLYCLDGKGTGDLAPLRLVAHFYSVGDDEEEVEGRVLPMFRELRAELRRRAKLIRELPREECPESKVTSALAGRKGLEPIVVGIDETQSYFGYGEHNSTPTGKRHKAVREELTAIVTDLVKRGPALGFITLLATQNVCEETIPRSIGTNAVIRAALKLFDHTTNDQVLGTGAYSRGIDATAFDIDDKGLLWLRADGDQPQVVRSVAGLDAVRAEKVAAIARAQREAADRLTGEAAGDVAAAEAVQVDFLADVRDVMDNLDGGRTTIHLTELAEALAALREAMYGTWDTDTLGSALRDAGVKVASVWVGEPIGKSAKGTRREWLEVAATADEDAGEDDVIQFPGA